MKSRSRFETLRDYVAVQPRQKTQGDIARELGLSESTFSQYLNGKRIPQRDTALRLSREFGISLEGLLNPGDVTPGEASA
jgi:transcriptional regulator with XRE-family HTH domain